MSGPSESSAVAPPQDDLIIEAGRTSSNYWTDLWHYRDLFRFLTLRDIKVRYKQTALGIGWAVVQPVQASVTS